MPDSDDDSDEDTQTTSVEDEAKRKEDMAKLVPGIEPSEYGQMPPSFHLHSQRTTTTRMDEEPDSEKVKEEVKASTNVPLKPLRKPIIPRDHYDGVDSDDETDEEEGGADLDSEDEEEKPQIVGEIEVDMGQEEEEFLEFSRQALGISDDHWNEILKDRKGRGGMNMCW
jgi:hypothetical protein